MEMRRSADTIILDRLVCKARFVLRTRPDIVREVYTPGGIAEDPK